MIKFEWICRKCNPSYPCRKSFTGYPDVYPHELSEEERKRCISPFRRKEDEHKAEWQQVKPFKSGVRDP